MAKREQKKLTDVLVRRAKLEPGRYADGGNLYLIVRESGARHWEFIYRWQGRLRYAGLGATHTVTLAEARERAAKARLQVHDGVDPLVAREQERASKEAKAKTFIECSLAYIEKQAKGWSKRHVNQWRATFTTTKRNGREFPADTAALNGLPVASIDRAAVLRVVGPLWETKTRTAARTRARIEAVLNYATVNGFRDGPNPATWSGNLSVDLPKVGDAAPAKHHTALAYDDMPAFMSELRAREGTIARALEFTILCATRTAETLGATWREVDLAKGLLVIGKQRMKAKRPHTVPLSDRSLAILKTLPKGKDDEFLFPREGGGQALPVNAMLYLLREMTGGVGQTTHGLRATFRSWSAAKTNFPSELCELALAHSVGDATMLAYMRDDMVERRRELMQAWASWCSRPAGGNVVDLPLRA